MDPHDGRYGVQEAPPQHGWYDDRAPPPMSSGRDRGVRGGGYEQDHYVDRGAYARDDRYDTGVGRGPPPPRDVYDDHGRGGGRRDDYSAPPPVPYQRYDEGLRGAGPPMRAHVDEPMLRAEAPADVVDFGRYPVVWKGQVGLKALAADVQIHVVSGAMDLISSLPPQPGPLKITKRMRLEKAKLAAVAAKLEVSSEYCMMLVRPDDRAAAGQAAVLRQSFVNYLQEKQAAGIADSQSGMFYVFPPCDFAWDHLARAAPTLDCKKALDGNLILVFTRH